MKQITIDETTDIFLDDIKPNQGKITISDTYHGAYTYYWGAMGSSLRDFILKINKEYFAGKLCRNEYRFSAKKTVRNLRKAIKEELPWYEYMEAQRELREEVKSLEDCMSAEEFVMDCQSIPNRLNLFGVPWDEQKEFLGRIEDIFTCEPWHFIDEEPSREYKWLEDLHGKLKKELR